jgi:antitoxin component YwqK of YwqJK toxin-antitoxin module
MNPNLFHRLVAGALATALSSLFMAFVIIVILYAPKPYPSVQPVIKQDVKQEDGNFQRLYWVGLLKSEWNYAAGWPEGPAYHFYPNGSLLRQLFYVQGRLNGPVREFYEKPGRATGFSRRFIAKHPPQAKLGAGQLKAEWNYQDGLLHGRYAKYDAKGNLREEGSYLRGKRHGFIRKYARDGRLVSERLYNEGKRIKNKTNVVF